MNSEKSPKSKTMKTIIVKVKGESKSIPLGVHRKPVEMVEVRAHIPEGVSGKFAVHKNVRDRSYWVITHAPSGLALPFFPGEITSMRHGLEVARRVAAFLLEKKGCIPDDPAEFRKGISESDIRARMEERKPQQEPES